MLYTLSVSVAFSWGSPAFPGGRYDLLRAGVSLPLPCGVWGGVGVDVPRAFSAYVGDGLATLVRSFQNYPNC